MVPTTKTIRKTAELQCFSLKNTTCSIDLRNQNTVIPIKDVLPKLVVNNSDE